MYVRSIPPASLTACGAAAVSTTASTQLAVLSLKPSTAHERPSPRPRRQERGQKRGSERPGWIYERWAASLPHLRHSFGFLEPGIRCAEDILSSRNAFGKQSLK